MNQFFDEVDALVAAGACELGLDPAPFLHLEASEDENLLSYLVEFDVPPQAWQEGNTFFVAPAGGGKTALRMYSSYSCWTGINHLLPVTLIPEQPELRFSHSVASDIVNLTLCKAIAQTVWLTLLFQPFRMLRLGAADKEELLSLLHRFLPAAPTLYIQQYQTSPGIGQLHLIRRQLDCSFQPPGMPDFPELQRMCAEIFAHPFSQQRIDESADTQAVSRWIEFVVKRLEFGGIMFLIDGLDNMVSEGKGSHAADWFNHVAEQILSYANTHIKAFVVRSLAYDIQMPNVQADRIDLRWTREHVVELLQKRVEVASQGNNHSLSELFDEPLFSFEDWALAAIFDLGIPHSRAKESNEARRSSTELQPRAAIDFARHLFMAYATRNNETRNPFLTRADLHVALHRYAQNPKIIGMSA